MPRTTSVTSLKSSTYIFTILLLLQLSNISSTFEIYRTGYQGNLNDVFMTSEGVCNTSSPSCHDYYASKVTCGQCKCADDNETFGYMGGSWTCFGKGAIRQNSGCFVARKQSTSNRLDVVSSTINTLLFLNLSQHAECTYQYNQDTYIRACDGRWLAAGHIGSTRYEMIMDKRTSPLRFRYWIKVHTDVEANKVFEGQIMRVNFRCTQAGLAPWNECFVFKEQYVTKPVICPQYFSTTGPSVTTLDTNSSSSPSLSSSTTAAAAATDDINTTENATTIASSSSNTTYSNQSNKGARVPKNVIIGVSAAGGGAILLAVIIICVCCCRKRKRQDISKYTAALYDSSQDQCSAGIYAETSIRLPSTSKSLSLTSHSNPSYERGKDFSIKLTGNRKLPSPSPTKSSPPRLMFSNESFEDDEGAMPYKRSPGIKQRGNMLVKYENVTILSDLRPESVPDAERFYDNPGDQPHTYHVLENSERAPSYAEGIPSVTEDKANNNPYEVTPNFGNSSPDHQTPSLGGSVEITSGACDTQEPIYANSPVISPRSPRDKAFDFEDVEPTEKCDDNEVKDSSSCSDDDQGEIYENSDIIRSSYLHRKAVENAGYAPSDEDDDDSHHQDHDDIHKMEPIYEKPSPMNNTADHISSHTGGSPLLRSKSEDTVYQDLKSVNTNDSEYQSLTPVVARKTNNKPKTKPKPKRQTQK